MVIRHDAPELQLGFMQLEREGSPPPGLRLPQAKLSRKSNQVARRRIGGSIRYAQPASPNGMGMSLLAAACSSDSGKEGEPIASISDAPSHSPEGPSDTLPLGKRCCRKGEKAHVPGESGSARSP